MAMRLNATSSLVSRRGGRVALGAIASLVSLGVRLRRSRGEERQQLVGFLPAVTVSPVFGGLPAAVVAVYIATVTLTGQFVAELADWHVALPATAVVAVVVLPLRRPDADLGEPAHARRPR